MVEVGGRVVSELVFDRDAVRRAAAYCPAVNADRTPAMTARSLRGAALAPTAARRSPVAGRRGAPLALSPGADPGPQDGQETISSQELADYTHINSTQIRRDLSGFGKFGKRGVGYRVESLVSEIRKILHTSGQHNIALFGAGNLGQAIASSDIFADHGFRDRRDLRRRPRSWSARRSAASPVRAFDDLEQVVEDEDDRRRRARGAGGAAQEVADRLVEAGVKIIFNYSERCCRFRPR